MIKYLAKYAGFSFWVALESIILMGLPRLVVFPVAAYLIGKDEFGFFLFAFGIVMIIGKTPSAGLATGLLRHLAEYDEEGQTCLTYTALRLCRILMVCLIFLGICVVGFLFYLGRVKTRAFLCFVPLILHLYFINMIDLRIAHYRVQRRFGVHAIWYCALGIALLLSLLTAMYWGLIGLAWGYLCAHLFVFVILYLRQVSGFNLSHFRPDQSTLLKSIWFSISLASLLALSSRYIYRVILGMTHSYADISVFFGATNVIDLCLSPMTILSSFLLSMLSGFREIGQIPLKKVLIVFVWLLSMSVLVAAAILMFGKQLLLRMFPEFGANSAELLPLVVVVVPCAAALMFSSPFIIKFGEAKHIAMLNLLALVSNIIAASILIPLYGTRGAATSYSIGYAVSACCWLGFSVLVFTKKHNSLKVPS